MTSGKAVNKSQDTPRKFSNYLPMFLGIILILVGVAFRFEFGDIFSIVIAQIGAILIGLFVSQLRFVKVTLPEIIEKAIFTSYELSNPEKLVEHLSNDRKDQKIALKRVIERMFGPESKPPSDLVHHVATSAATHAFQGFYRENYDISITLKSIDKNHPLATNKKVSQLYFEAAYRAEYTAINVSGKKTPYRIKLNLENFSYEGIPCEASISIQSFNCLMLRRKDDSIVDTFDLKSEILQKCPEKINPQISEETIVFVNLNTDPDPEKKKILEDVLTKEINPGEKLKVVLNWTMYLKKQDYHEATASYFTKGFSMRLVAPSYVTAIFRPHFSGSLDPHSTTSPSGVTTRTWITHDFVHPNEGGVIVWKVRK